jgi:aarF domain-containing kinase
VQIAQVHRATLLNGQEVVVKVQHEGIKRIILEVLHALAFKILG